MSITSSSTMAEIFAAHPLVATTDQQAGLTSITLKNTSIIKVGLASLELTAFKADCATATTNCTPASYTTFDGYALYGMLSDAKAQTDLFGACFADKTCFGVNPSGDNYAYTTLELATAASASVPADLDGAISDCSSNTGGFHAKCFGFEIKTVVSADARAWRFVANTDTTYVAGATT
jgi:hypothetical protein